MVNLKTELGKPKQDGTQAIYIRVSNGRTEYKRIRFYMDAHKGDIRKGEIVSEGLMFALGEEVQRMRRKLMEAGSMVGTWPIGDIVKLLTEDTRSLHFQLDFFEFGQKVINELINEGRDATASGYRTSLNNFKRFIGKDKLDINEITKNLLLNYQEWFKRQDIGSRAWEMYMSCLQALHNRAKKQYNDEEDGVVPIKYSPFSKVDFKRSAKEVRAVEKRAISIAAIRYIRDIPDEVLPPKALMARDAFLLSFCLCGMNAADMFEHRTGEGGDRYRICYSRKKTRDRSGEATYTEVTVPEVVRPIHDRWAGKRHTWIYAEKYSTPNTLNHALNEGVKDMVQAAVWHYGNMWRLNIMTDKGRAAVMKRLELPADLTFYSARHSWATIAANDCNVRIDIVDRCLCHVVKSMAVAAYIKRDYREVDEANNAVIKLVFGDK